MIVVHADGGKDVEAEGVPALDQGGVRIFAALPHGPHGFGPAHMFDSAIAAVFGIAPQRQVWREPGRLVGAHTPEERSHLGVFQRGIDDVEQLVDGLRVFGVAVRRTVPIENDAVGWGAFFHNKTYL